MLVAADTFRAAAADQLQGWADRSGASLERPNSSKQRPDGVINMALDKVRSLSIERFVLLPPPQKTPSKAQIFRPLDLNFPN